MDESDPSAATVCRTGDDEPFEAQVRRYQERVFRLAVSVLGAGHESDAEEVAQDAFLQAYRARHRFRGLASWSTWIYRITYNTAINRSRRLQSERRRCIEDGPVESSAATASPLDDAIAAQRKEALRQAIEALPDLYRTVLRLHYWLGCPVEEIAEYLDSPAGTVKSYLHRARARLQAILTRKGITA
jgi:RNA polymerase sigma-70 factor (ECF subfamily)